MIPSQPLVALGPPHRTTQTMLRELLTKLALACGALILSLIGVELVLRAPVFETTPFRPDNVRSRNRSPMSRPDLREPRAAIPPRSDAFRILVVGDSFAWGDGLHTLDAFPFRLERQLNALSDGRRFEVINWSHAGWSTRHQVNSLQGKLAGLDPDLMILSFVLNDPEPRHARERERKQVQLYPRKPNTVWGAFLYRHSRLFAFAWTRVDNTRIRRELTTYYFELFEDESWLHCRWALGDLQELAAADGIPIAMVIWPIFDTEVFDDSYPYLELIAKAEKAARSLKWPVLDLFPSFRGLDGRRLALIPYTDSHPSDLAHRIGADAILHFLIEHRLVPVVLDTAPPATDQD
jgi:hypothetical protein